MKTINLILVILFTGILLSGCDLDPNHSVRINNQYPEDIYNMQIGEVSYGHVVSGDLTGYKPMEEGTHALSGTTASSMTITGTVSISGKGTHKWTMKITSSGGFEIRED